MPKFRLRHAFVAVLLLVAMLAQGTWALAGTTGGIDGTLTDTTTGKPVADASVTVVSPSQSASTTTDSGGHFNFLALNPDTYTVSANKAGYAPVSVAGVTVFADQSQTLTLQTHPQLRTIVTETSRAAGNLVKPGTTADVYSVNAATQQVVSGSGGGFNLNQAYSGIYSQPGVTSYIGNYGWGQVFYIRGSAYSQIGYEFDGVPVNRAFDNYQANSLSSLGQQELQVYTGGSPSGASSATLGGFINQVIKTGTYPGFGNLKGGIGAPGFYHALQAEAGGASPNRNFSYYVGILGYNQHFPYGTYNNLNNIAYNGTSSYGLLAPREIATQIGDLFGVTNLAPPDGGGWVGQFTNGPWPSCQNGGANGGEPVGYSAANPGPYNGTCYGYGPFGNGYTSDMFERDNVLNFHFGLPHKYDSGRDDLQLLYDNSMQYQLNESDIADQGGLGYINGFLTPFAGAGTVDANGNPYTGAYTGLCGYENTFGVGCADTNSPIPYIDSKIFAPGTQFGQPAASAVINPYYFPNSPTNRALNTPFAPTAGLPTTLRDGFWNDVGILKAQYTKNIGSNAYARLFGYTFYSDWLINGPDCAATGYIDGLLEGGLCGNTGDYELATHTRGAEFQFADQLNPANLLRFTANYTTAGVTRWNNSSWLAGYYGSRTGVTNLTNGNPSNPMCFNYKTGAQGSCFSSSTYGTFFGSGPTRGQAENPCGTTFTALTTPAAYGPTGACTNGATWQVTVPSGQGTYNTVRPVFTSFALEDEFKPNDKLDLNLGVRLENYQYNLQNSNNPEFNFWFNAGAQVNCYDPGTGLPQLTPLAPGQPVPPNPVQTNPGQSCPIAPSGQVGVHPTGGVGPDAGPLLYSANSPNAETRQMFSPRVGGTYTLSPDDVLRFSAGKYTQPTETAFEQYLDQSGKRAAAFDFTQFWGLGFHTPAHDNPVQYSNNFDFSWEHHFHNSDVTMKVSPFYRDTHNEIVTLVLGPGFVSGVNVGHQHSSGVELSVQKGDPSRDGLSGQLSYTYTKALVQYGNLPNGTNGIDYLNNYIKAFNALTQAGGGAACYSADGGGPGGTNSADPTCTPVANPAGGFFPVITNPYYSESQQGLLARDGYYPSYPNEPPNDPYDQGGSSAIAPHMFSGWLQYRHGRLAIAPNFELIAGTYYGSPTDVYGVDPRVCGGNQAGATTGGATVAPVASAYPNNPDFLTCPASPYVQSGYLAIPNPFTGSMDSVGKYQEPWQFNLGALVRYDLSPTVTANLTLTNLVNRCFGGSKAPWATAYPANSIVCGYGQGNGNYIGPVKGQPGFGGGFFYGANAQDPANGTSTSPGPFNYPFTPFFGAEPFQAYLEVQVKL